MIKEAATAEKEALKDEADSQAGYEEFIKNSNAAIAKARSSRRRRLGGLWESKILQIFGGLVLGCIETDFCKEMCV